MWSSFTRPHAVVVNPYGFLSPAEHIRRCLAECSHSSPMCNALNVFITVVSERVGSSGDRGAQMGPGERRGGTRVSGSELQRTL